MKNLIARTRRPNPLARGVRAPLGKEAMLVGSPGHWPGPSGDPPLGMGKVGELFRSSLSGTNIVSIPSGQWPDGTGESPMLPVPTSEFGFTTDPRIRFGPGGGVYRIITTGAESLGRHFVFEAIEPPGGGPPLHSHANEDEYFFVLEGKVTFHLAGRVIVAKRGESAYVPRGAAHCFKNCSPREARMLVLFTPGKIEGFFDYGLPVNGEIPSDEYLLERVVELGPQYGLEVLGRSPL